MVTFSLNKPVEHNGKAFSVLVFREATAGDLILAERVAGGTLGKTVAILASMCDVPLPAFQQITARELNRILAATAELLGNEPESATGD